MPPERPGMFPAFAGVALADILANSVAIVIIMIVVTLMARYEEEQDKLEQAEDVAVLLSRELASSFVMNALPTSPPAQLHDYVTSPLDRNPQRSIMPIIELHADFIRDYYTGETYSREELLRYDNAFDRYLGSLTPAQLLSVRVDVYAIDQFYVAMSIFKAHNHRPRHWHFLGTPGGTGLGGQVAAVARADGDGIAVGTERRDGEPGTGPAAAGDAFGAGAALPEDVALARAGGVDANYPADAFAARGGAGAASQEFFDLPGGPGDESSNDAGRPPASATADTGTSAAGGSRSFRAARPAAPAAETLLTSDVDLFALLRALYAYMRVVQADADAGVPSRLPRYDFERDVLGRIPNLPAPTPAETGLLHSVRFLMEDPRSASPSDGLAIRVQDRADVQGQAIALFPHEPLGLALWRRDSDQPRLNWARDRATVTMRLGTHAEIHEGLRVALPRDGIVLVPGSEPGAGRDIKWRVVTLVNPERTDFVTGFVYAGFDTAGRMVLPVDENAVDIGGVRVESVRPSIAFRSETRQVLLYGLIALVFALGLVGRYWKAA
ncbi:MAG: hypothetical protein OXH15_22820 [Gammaproteobacteria bacterium]|nr:hypothetical protein [Gammaproteobacteria bacterium]